MSFQKCPKWLELLGSHCRPSDKSRRKKRSQNSSRKPSQKPNKQLKCWTTSRRRTAYSQCDGTVGRLGRTSRRRIDRNGTSTGSQEKEHKSHSNSAGKDGNGRPRCPAGLQRSSWSWSDFSRYQYRMGLKSELNILKSYHVLYSSYSFNIRTELNIIFRNFQEISVKIFCVDRTGI